MNITHGFSLTLLLAAAAPTPVFAQAESSQPAGSLAERSLGQGAQGSSIWRVPIHEHKSDPEAGRYGIWAAGPGFKVSFHDGMEMHPVLGPTAERGLPLRWTTRRISIGEQVIDLNPRAAAAARGRKVDDWRFAYDLTPRIQEIYDVGADGVEQSFVLEHPGGQPRGALTVEGQVRTELVPTLLPEANSAQAQVRFEEAGTGREILNYGTAIAFDARGNRTAVATSLRNTENGDTVSLTVPAAFVERAVWPITVDPLFSPNLIVAGSDIILDSDVAVSGGPSDQRILTTWTVAVTATDEDVYAYTSETDFNNENLIFSDISTAIETLNPSAAFLRSGGTSGRWMIAVERRFAAAQARIRVWFHDEGNTVAQSGGLLFLPVSGPGLIERNPDIGGSDGNSALLVYQVDETSDYSNTSTTDVRYTFVNSATSTFEGTSFVTSGSSIRDQEEPSVSQCADDPNEDWIVCYQQRTLLGGAAWQIRGRRISRFGTNGTDTRLLSSESANLPNMIEPAVDGKFGNFVVSGFESSGSTNGNRSVSMQRFLWGASAAPVLQWRRTVATTGVISPFRELSIAHDTVSRSHWGIAYRQGNDNLRLLRVGFDGATVGSELAISVAGARGPAIAFDPSNDGVSNGSGGYVHTFAQPSLFGNGINGQRWTYPINAQAELYGSPCGSGSISASLRPLLGDQAWTQSLNGAVPNTPAALFIGFSQAAIDLTSIGMNSCSLWIGGPIVSLPFSTDSSGRAAFGLDLSSPLDLYLQWVYVAPGANTLGVLATQGLSADIR